MAVRTVQDLAVQVAQDENLAREIKADPTSVIATIASTNRPFDRDPWIWRIVIGALSFALLMLIYFIFLAGADAPEALTGALGP